MSSLRRLWAILSIFMLWNDIDDLATHRFRIPATPAMTLSSSIVETQVSLTAIGQCLACAPTEYEHAGRCNSLDVSIEAPRIAFHLCVGQKV
jgi:hypothetical protein